MKYRKKPVVIEAIQYTGPFSYDEMVMEWGERFQSCSSYKLGIVIRTLEGVLYAGVSDWIIKGIKGEFYPIKNDIFLETYDLIE